MNRVRHHGFNTFMHQGMRRVQEEGCIAFGCGLETQLAVAGHGCVHERDGIGEATVVEGLE